MTEKTFNIRVPKQIYQQPTALFAWMNSHVNPGMPIHSTHIDIKSFEPLYEKFKARLERTLSLSTVQTYREQNNIQPMTLDTHAAWCEQQEVEVKISFISDGRFEVKFMLFGPAHTEIPGQLDLGYMDLINFELGLFYDRGPDTYHIVYKDPFAGETVQLIGEDVVPLKLFPVYSFDYTRDPKTSTPPLTTQELFDKFRNEFSEAMWDNTIEIKNHEKGYVPEENNFYGYEAISDALTVLELQMFTADAFAGNFFLPLMLSAFCIEVPVKEGVLTYTRVTFSYGQRVTMMLPSLLLKEDRVSNEFTYVS